MKSIKITNRKHFTGTGKTKLLILTDDSELYGHVQQKINFTNIELIFLNTFTNIKEFIEKLKPDLIFIKWVNGDSQCLWLDDIINSITPNVYLQIILSEDQEKEFFKKFNFQKNIYIYPQTANESWLINNLKSFIDLVNDLSFQDFKNELADNILLVIKNIHDKSDKEEILQNLVLSIPKFLPYDYYGIGWFMDDKRQIEIFKQFEPPEKKEFLIHNLNFEKNIVDWVKGKRKICFDIFSNPEEINKFRSWGWQCEEIEIIPILKEHYISGFFLLGNKRKKTKPIKEIHDGIKLISNSLIQKTIEFHTTGKKTNYKDEFSLRAIGKALSEESFFKTLSEIINEMADSTITIFWQLKKGFNILFPKFIYSKNEKYQNTWKKSLIYLDDNWLFKKILNDDKWEVLDFIAENEELPQEDLSHFIDLNCRHILVVPFKDEEEVGCFTAITFKQEQSIKPWYLNQLDVLIKDASRLYRMVQVNKEADLKFRQLNKIFELGKDLKIELQQKDVLKKIVLTIRKTLGWNDVAVLLYDESKILHLEQIVGFTKNIRTHLNPRQEISEDKVDLLLEECEKISHSYMFIDELTQDSVKLSEISMGVWEAGDEVIVPIETSRAKLGCIVLKDPIQRLRPEIEDIQAIEYFANQMAVALENSIFYSALKNSEERYRLLAETLPLGLVTCNENGEIIYWNPQFSELAGNDGDLLNKSVMDFFTHQGENILDKFINVLNTKTEKHNLEEDLKSGIELLIINPKEDEPIPVAAFITPLGNSGESSGFFMVINDIRMQKRLEKMRENFNSMIVHDLRSPLNVIQGFLDLLIRETLGKVNAEQNDVMKISMENVRKVLNLVDNFLIVSKMKAGRFSVTMQLGNLNNLIEKNVNQHKVIINNKKISIKTKLNENIPLILFDSFRLEQVLNNLISNAVKYVEKNGKIEITTSLKKEKPEKDEEEKFFVLISVKDNGAGIPEDKINKIFQVFEMAHVNSSTQREGTGLGLAICKEIVEAHHGNIWAESEVKKYSNFKFTLPIPKSQSLMEMAKDS